jgi:hypothetical protein
MYIYAPLLKEIKERERMEVYEIDINLWQFFILIYLKGKKSEI